MRSVFQTAILFASVLFSFVSPLRIQGAEPLQVAMPVLEGAQLRLQWSGGTGPFQLQDAASPAGPWSNVGASISGTETTVTLLQSQRFFRVTGASGGGNSGQEALRATMLAAQTFVNTVPTEDRPAWRTQVLNFLNGRADINSAGETADGVWAITTDGIPLAFWNNRESDPFDPGDMIPEMEALRTQTPGNTSARFATTVGSGFRLAGPRLARQLSTHGYTTTRDSAPLDSLKGLRNESVFFFNTHGGMFKIPKFDANGKLLKGDDGEYVSEPMYGLWSGTKIDPESADPGYNEELFGIDIEAKRLAICFAPVSVSTNAAGEKISQNEWHFGITAQWVRDYMTFPKANHASIWLGACLSGSADAADLRNAFREAGADMVSGWTQNVSGEAILTATSFLYDRLLGANEVQPPAVPQRPFNYADSWTELRSKGLHKHFAIDNAGHQVITEIIYEGATGDDSFGLFAPSIAYVLIDETSDRAYLIGIFGTPPASAGVVKIGGVDATVVSWEPRKIVCSLPRTGDGSAGDVQVIVHGLKSNIRRITRWTVNGAYKMIEPDTPHVVNGTLKLIFRADVGEYRNVPGNILIQPTRYAVGAQSSEVRLEASGVVSDPCGNGGNETVTWFGSALFPTYDPTGPQVVHAVVSLNTIDQAGAFGLAFGMRDGDSFPLKMKVVFCEGFDFTFPLGLGASGPVELDPLLFGSPTEEPLPDGSKYEYPLPGGVFVFGSDWAIPAGRADSETDSGMTWNRAEAEFPPDPAAAR